MRVATSTVSDTIIRQIQLLSSQQSKLQNQVATGQRISQPEDDPAAVGRVLNLETEQRNITQYGTNTAKALEIAQASFSGLQSIKTISDRAGELGTLGAGVLGSDAMAAYATETDQLIEQAVQSANTRFNGNYIYAGTAVDSPAITVTRDSSGQITAATYAGNTAQASIPLSEAASVTPSTNGTTNAGLATFINNLVALRNALNSGDTTAVTAAQGGLTSSEDLLVGALADNGGVQTRIEASQAQQADRSTSVDQLISSETSADLPATIVQLNQTQTAYQAALQSAANIMHLSLLDYIK
ncbi:MAG TPA: flagellin [Lacunisphaera sp.]|jgi:flagellar hook-associated protein 3 FlgL